ncbi:MAG: Uma2 family endonuclease [Bryobacteraceae bacterium]
MATATHVSLAEYLGTEYEPDCEYLDGAVEERNVGKRKHSKTQALLAARLQREIETGSFDVLVEQRVQLSSSKIRIPDICVIAAENKDEVIQNPPALWIEILSPEDRWGRVQAKIDDCLRFGVEALWIIDPYSRQAWSATPRQAMTEVLGGKLTSEHPHLEIPLEEILPQD